MKQRSLKNDEKIDWIRLIRSQNVGPVTFYHLLKRYGSAAAALDALPEIARRNGRKDALAICSKNTAQAEMAGYEKIGARLIAACEPDYPERLNQISDAPPLINIKGHGHLLAQKSVALVGARNASANGHFMAKKLAQSLGESGYALISGLARGIDTATHMASLASGTIAVVGNGLDVVYPPENQDLYQKIMAQGAIVSEYPAGTEPQARHFPARNRIIAGLALGVVVVEAALKSGSLITAKRALDYDRDVFAVPGSPLDPRYQGNNALLKDGAHLVENADDIITILQGLGRSSLFEQDHIAADDTPLPPVSENDLDRVRQRVQQLLSPNPVLFDDLAGLLPDTPPAIISIVMTELEIAGKIDRQPGGKICLLASENNL